MSGSGAASMSTDGAQGMRVDVVAHSPLPFQPAVGSSMRPFSNVLVIETCLLGSKRRPTAGR